MTSSSAGHGHGDGNGNGTNTSHHEHRDDSGTGATTSNNISDERVALPSADNHNSDPAHVQGQSLPDALPLPPAAEPVDAPMASADTQRPSTPTSNTASLQPDGVAGLSATDADAPTDSAVMPSPAPPQTPINRIGPNIDQPMPDAPGIPVAAPGHQLQDPHRLEQQPLQQSAPMDVPNGYFAPVDYYAMKDHMDGSLDDPAQLMLAMASMAGTHASINAMAAPSTVTPSQVTLPNLLESELAPAHTIPANTLRQAGNHKALESFARIEFPDSVFQMTTYAVVIGRDQRALEQARRDEKRAEEYRRQVEERARSGLPPPSPIVHDRSKFSKSYISEEGGMLGPESDSEDNARPTKRRRTSTAGSSQNDNEDGSGNVISDRQYVSHTPGAAAVDLASLRPSPWHVPFLGIHSSGPDMISKTKAISREHLKIRYNQSEGIFEAVPMHTNGFFCEDVHCHSGRVVLKCGDRLQIKDIAFRFIINGVERGRTGAEDLQEEEAPRKRHSQGGKEMSFDFEGSHGDGEMRDTSEELSEMADSPAAPSELGLDDDDDEEEAEVPEDMEPEVAPSIEEPVAEKTEPMLGSELMLQHIPKKRGPGRPPKNGIMSKREQRLLKKQQQEMAKKALPLEPPVEPPIKRKVGRPRKHPLPDDPDGERPEKRKYTPRKPKDENNPEGSDAERQAREAKERKARPKSPPLNLRKEDYTEQELQKPNRNYGLLIDEVLTKAGPAGLSLKQIYKRICEKYPYFYFFPETKGWESSVRHNLLGNKAFHKIAGGVWTRVPGIELDAGKKRKTSPPRRVPPSAGYGGYPYPYNGHMTPGAPGFPPGQSAVGYQAPGYHAQPGQAAQTVQQFVSSASPTGQPAQPAVSQPAAPAQMPGYGAPPALARPPFGVPQPGGYSSPYAPRPPPPASNLPVAAVDGATPVAPPPAPPPVSAPPRPAPVAGSASSPPLAAAPRNGPSATPPATAPARPVIEPRLLAAVVGLKNGLIDNLAKAGNPKAEAIVMSALNRCIGLKKDATENDKMEAICIRGIRQVIDGSIKGKSPTPGGSVPPTGPPPIFGERVLDSINGFKNVSITALKPKIGEARAELVALSAIDRVLGFTDKSLLPKPAEGEPVGNLDGVEGHIMNSVRQLLVGMNQKLHGSA